MKGIDGIILAAGLSSRMGRYKMTVDIGGLPMIEKTTKSLKIVCENIFVVGGYRIEEIRKIFEKYENIRVIENTEYSLGMFSSVLTGLRASKGEKIFIHLGDIPFVSVNTLKILLRQEGGIIIPTYEGKKGHPALITREIANKILKENINSKLNEVFNNYGYKTLETNDNSILSDIDSEEDYKLLTAEIQ